MFMYAGSDTPILAAWGEVENVFSMKVSVSAEDTQLAYCANNIRVYPKKKKNLKNVIQELHSDRHKRQKAIT